jgi:hypothetical protein
MKITFFWVETLCSLVKTLHTASIFRIEELRQASTQKIVLFIFTAVRTSDVNNFRLFDWLWRLGTCQPNILVQISITAASEACRWSTEEERKWTWFWSLPWPIIYPASGLFWLHFCLFNWFNYPSFALVGPYHILNVYTYSQCTTSEIIHIPGPVIHIFIITIAQNSTSLILSRWSYFHWWVVSLSLWSILLSKWVEWQNCSHRFQTRPHVIIW